MTSIEKQRSNKEIKCAGCKRKGMGEYVLHYENCVLSDVILKLPDGWDYRPFANNGEAPICTACLKELKFISDAEYS